MCGAAVEMTRGWTQSRMECRADKAVSSRHQACNAGRRGHFQLWPAWRIDL